MKQADLQWKSGVVTFWDLDELNLSESIESQVEILKEDLMQVQYGDTVLDLGWHPDFNSQGQFLLSVVKSRDWENPIWQVRFRELSQLTPKLNQGVEIAERHASN